MVIHHPNNKAEFDALLVSAAGRQLIVIDFFAAWCGPCRMITPKFEAFSEEFPSVLFIKIDIDEQEEIAEDFKIDVMPTFVFLKDGNRLKRVVGNVPEEVHEAIIELSQ